MSTRMSGFISWVINLAFWRIINELVARVHPDRIFCQLIRVAEYVKHFNIRKILDYQDVMSKGMQRRALSAPFWKRWFFKAEFRRLRRQGGDQAQR